MPSGPAPFVSTLDASANSRALTITAIPGIGEVGQGDDLAVIVIGALDRAGVVPENGDIYVIAQKIVSKAEGRSVDLARVKPSPEALKLAAITDKDPRLVELILGESDTVVRAVPKVLIVRHRRGWVMANAGIDRSNVPSGEGEERVLLLPEDPDASAAALQGALCRHYGVALAVVIADSFGRPWRLGVTQVAIGCAGLAALVDRRGETDRQGRALEVTEVALADAVACAAGLASGEGAEGLPVVLVRGLSCSAPELSAAALVRRPQEDLFL